MPLRPLSNPYDDLENDVLDKCSVCVSSVDHAYVRRIFCTLVGLDDKLFSILYHNLVTLLRAHEQLHGPLETPTHSLHPSYSVLRSCLERSTAGRTSGSPDPQHDGGGQARVCAENGTDAKLGPVSQGRDERENHGREAPSDKDVREGLSRTGPSGWVITVTSETLLETLRAKGIM